MCAGSNETYRDFDFGFVCDAWQAAYVRDADRHRIIDGDGDSNSGLHFYPDSHYYWEFHQFSFAPTHCDGYATSR